MFGPMNPAPPVIKNIPALVIGRCRTNICPSRSPGAILRCLGLQMAPNRLKIAAGQEPAARGNGWLAGPVSGATGSKAPIDKPEFQAGFPAGAHRSLRLDR